MEVVEPTTEISTPAAPQHLMALERANEVRLARAALKRRIAEGERAVADVILSTPHEADGMAIADLLTSQRRWGSARCRKFLRTMHIHEQKKVGTLTDRQRTQLADLLARVPASPAPALVYA